MINAIGAYIVGVIAVALILHPPPFSKWNTFLCEQAPLSHFCIGVLLSGLLARNFWPSIDNLAPLAWVPGLVFDGANLWIHEAGHGFLMFAPIGLLIAGGTLL